MDSERRSRSCQDAGASRTRGIRLCSLPPWDTSNLWPFLTLKSRLSAEKWLDEVWQRGALRHTVRICGARPQTADWPALSQRDSGAAHELVAQHRYLRICTPKPAVERVYRWRVGSPFA